MRYFVYILLMLTLASCSAIPVNEKQADSMPVRGLAADTSCSDIAKSFLINENYEKDLNKVLAQKKLITFTEKKAQIHYPKLEWINKVRKSFNQSLRNWNNNRYPSFYLFNKEDIIPIAKKYSENIEDEEIKASLDVSDWLKSFKNYKLDLDQLIEERISLQYNISLLKKLKLEEGTPRDIQITIKRGGELKNEIITFRKEDKNLSATINKLRLEMKDLDGTVFKNGRIKDRIIRQAMLLDMLTILHREMEYVIKNSAAPNDETIEELSQLSLLLKNADFSPSTYGLYKIENKVFIRELITASKVSDAYVKIKEPFVKLKTIVTDYFKNRKAGTDIEKVGFLKRVYAKITSITPKQAATGGGSVVVAGIGFERYFAFKEKSVSEVNELPLINELESSDLAHQQQLEQSEKVEAQKNDEHSSVVEINVDELAK